MLQRAAARAGHTMSCRVIVSSFDAALRVVAAGRGIRVIPRQVSLAFTGQRRALRAASPGLDDHVRVVSACS